MELSKDLRTVDQLQAYLSKEFSFTKRSPGAMSEAFALAEDWEGQCVLCHPSGNLAEWARKCFTEGLKPDTTVVLLAPAKTDASYFHEYILHHSEIGFVQGRLTQQNGGRPAVGSLVAVYRGPQSRGVRAAIEELLRRGPRTSAEIHHELKHKGYRVQINGVTPRLSELNKAGRILKAGKRICSATGRMSTCWIASNTTEVA